MQNKKRVLLYSGGTDSWLIKELWSPDVLLYVDMDTMYSREELVKVRSALSKEDEERFVIAHFPLGQWEDVETAFIPQRNMFLLMVAANYGNELCLGATKEDAGGSSDKDVDFLIEAEAVLKRLWKPQSLYEGKEIEVEKEFVQYTKADLLRMYLERGGDVNRFKNETFSCYSPLNTCEECLFCKACFRKFVVCYGNEATYTKEELERVYAFAEESVVHSQHHAQGRYFLEKNNGEEVMAVLKRLYKELGKELVLD